MVALARVQLPRQQIGLVAGTQPWIEGFRYTWLNFRAHAGWLSWSGLLKSPSKTRGASGFEGGAPVFTVGDLRAELAKWDEGTVITFRSSLQRQEFRFYRFQRLSRRKLEIAINQYPQTPTVRPPARLRRKKQMSETDVGSSSRTTGRHIGRSR